MVTTRSSWFYAHTSEIIFLIAGAWMLVYVPAFFAYLYIPGSPWSFVAPATVAGFSGAGPVCVVVLALGLDRHGFTSTFKQTSAIVVTILLMVLALLTFLLFVHPSW